jgi:hypothetical protein
MIRAAWFCEWLLGGAFCAALLAALGAAVLTLGERRVDTAEARRAFWLWGAFAAPSTFTPRGQRYQQVAGQCVLAALVILAAGIVLC